MKAKLMKLVIVALAVAAVGFAFSGQAAQDLRLALPEAGHLAAADVREPGWGLVAWHSDANQWSQVEVFRNGDRTAAWDFQELLVKGARWAEPGELLMLDVVGDQGPHTRLYSIVDGELRLDWSTGALGGRFASTSLSPDGRFWLGSRFEVEASEVVIGRVGETDPLWTWRLDGERLGQPTRARAENFSYAFFLREPAAIPDVGILWGARLWLARASSPHLVRIEPPKGCHSTLAAAATATGIWIQCFRGIEAEPSHLWALYPEGFSAAAVKRLPAFVEHFRAPEFLADGKILDRHNREGRAEIYELAADGSGVEHLGTIPFPAESRTIVAGDALLVEEVESTEEYRARSLARIVGTLRSSK